MRYAIILSVLSILSLCSCQAQPLEPLQHEIDSISKNWLPDKRVGVCNFTLVEHTGNTLILKGESLFPQAKVEVLKLLQIKVVNVVDSVLLLPDTLHVGKVWGLVTLSIANMRAKPSHASEMLSQAIMGTPVRILKNYEGWIFIQTPDNYVGWTNKSAVYQLSFDALENWRKSDRIINTSSEGNVFADSKHSIVLSDLVAGAILVKKGQSKGSTSVLLPDGRAGFVADANWIHFNRWRDTASLHSDRMVLTGKQLMGFPYLWGGTSSKGMDCSGFIKTICLLNGVIVERDASQQVHHGLEIDITDGWDKLQKGDLLFFGSKLTKRVNHVGLYIGDSEVLHESGSVHINSLDKKRSNYNNELYDNLLAARRVIGYSSQKGIVPLKLHKWY
jgi:gamma-D-glutamyl-L-lysine dipeptidyl-peptidase